MRILFSVIGVCLSFIAVLTTVLFVSFALLMLTMGPDEFLRDLSHGDAMEPIVFTFLVVLLLFSAFFRGAMGIFRGSRVERVVVREKAQTDTDEARLIQEIHNSVSGFERRIEALETILIDRHQAARF